MGGVPAPRHRSCHRGRSASPSPFGDWNRKRAGPSAEARDARAGLGLLGTGPRAGRRPRRDLARRLGTGPGRLGFSEASVLCAVETQRRPFTPVTQTCRGLSVQGARVYHIHLGSRDSRSGHPLRRTPVPDVSGGDGLMEPRSGHRWGLRSRYKWENPRQRSTGLRLRFRNRCRR